MPYTVKFNVKFVWEGDANIPWHQEPFQRLCERDYVTLREEAIDTLNKMYEQWNHEFAESGLDEDHYIQYIRSKQKPILDEVNSKHTQSMVKLSSGSDGDIIAITKCFSKPCTIKIVLVPA